MALLSILAGTQDYQLADDAHQFRHALEDTITQRDELMSEQVNGTLAAFIDRPVNARLRSQKKDRLVRMVDNGFDEWFLDTYPDRDPVRVWEEIAAGLETYADAESDGEGAAVTPTSAVDVEAVRSSLQDARDVKRGIDVEELEDIQQDRSSQLTGAIWFGWWSLSIHEALASSYTDISELWTQIKNERDSTLTSDRRWRPPVRRGRPESEADV